MKWFYTALLIACLNIPACSTARPVDPPAITSSVAVKVYDDYGHGSLFAFHETATHYICGTAAHVAVYDEEIVDEETGEVLAEGLKVNGVDIEVLAIHEEADIAVVAVPKSAGPMVVLEVAAAEVGDVAAIGYAGLATGSVITYGRILDVNSREGDVILVDIQAIPGMSGGPLMQNGKVVGIVSRSAITWGQPHFGLTYFEPATRLFEIYADLKASN